MVKSAFVISDIHLGASTSLLTAIDYDTETEETYHRPLAETILQKLFEDIRDRTGGERIQQCILLGDIFDFSFAPYGLAMQNGRWFFQQLVGSKLFEEFVYIPGNHDHHLWQQISEHYYLMTELENPPLNYPKTLPANFTLQNTFMDRLLPEGHGIQVTYPNYEFSVYGRQFYLHHGHFLQKLYVAASRFLAETIHTKNIEDLEVLNSPFLEFGWYNIGQAYNIGKTRLIDRLYFMFKNNKTTELDRVLRLILKKIDQWDTQKKKVRRWHPMGMLNDTMIKFLGPFFLKRLFFKHTRLFGKRQHASSTRHERLADNLYVPVMEYIQTYMIPDKKDCKECTFIFGHTHEPEENYICTDEKNVCYHIYNTGGWIVDQLDEAGRFILPKMSPVLIGEDGSVNALPFTKMHEDFLRSHLETDPYFQEIKQQHMMR